MHLKHKNAKNRENKRIIELALMNDSSLLQKAFTKPIISQNFQVIAIFYASHIKVAGFISERIFCQMNIINFGIPVAENLHIQFLSDVSRATAVPCQSCRYPCAPSTPDIHSAVDDILTIHSIFCVIRVLVPELLAIHTWRKPLLRNSYYHNGWVGNGNRQLIIGQRLAESSGKTVQCQ